MAKRARVSSGKDKRIFRNTAKKTKDMNINPKSMRGGIRL